MAELADNGLNRKIVDAATVAKEVDALEAEIAELRAAYDQYFLGIERRPPNLQHQALKKKLLKVKGAFVRQTAIKFRINMVQQKFASYERLWLRTLQEIENGTYKRDLFKAKLHKKEREAPKKAAHEVTETAESLEDVLSEVEIVPPEPIVARPAAPAIAPVAAAPKAGAPKLAPAVPGVAPVAKPGTPATPIAPAKPGTPVPAARPVTGATPVAAKPGTPPVAARPVAGATPAAARPPTPGGGNPPLSEQKLRAVYDAYVTAKKRCQEDTSKLSYEQVAANLRKQVPELMKKSGAASVEFKIVIKDGKAVLRAIPK